MTTILRTSDFVWRGLSLHHRGKPVLTVEPDETYPHLYRIRYPSGWTSPPANHTRAKDAAYRHARCLLAQETARKRPYSPEVEVWVNGEAA